MSQNMAILGRKLGMTRVFERDGGATAVTVIAAGPCPVIQIRDEATDGYTALQIGYDEVPERKVNKPERGHLAKSGVEGLYRHLREVRLDDVSQYTVGQAITVDIFQPGDRVKVTGTSKGKGFQGVMKRWGFAGLPDSHGHEKVHRSPGSIGMCTEPGRVLKGKRMPGQMGNKRVTQLGLIVIDVRPEENLILVKGAIPGPTNGLVLVRKQK